MNTQAENGEDRRRHPRIDDQNAVAVTILSAPETPELEDRKFFCLSRNISAEGLMLRVNAPVSPGAVLQLQVGFRKPIRSFGLSARVVWAGSGDKESGYPIGLQLVLGENRDYDAWRRIVEQKVRFHDKAGA